MTKKRTTMIWLAALGLLAADKTYAEGTRTGSPLLVNPAANSRPGVAAAGNVTRSGTEGLKVRIINSCYATNLRGVANPLAPSSNIEAKLHFTFNGTDTSLAKTLNLTVNYPAILVTKEGIPEVPDGPLPAGALKADVDGHDITDQVTAGFYGNLVGVDIKPDGVQIVADELTLDASGKLTVTKHNMQSLALGSSEYWQHITTCDGGPVYGSWGWSSTMATYPCGAYMGHEGLLTTGSVSVSIASDNRSVDVAVPFPGQTAFCGGYYSPLMLFLDSARPKFNGLGNFKLSEAGKTFWVEPGAPGYFLVWDRNHNGIVDGKEELFGDQDSDKNGFDALKELDSNHDGVIDSKDAKWKELMLWQDKNGDGIAQPEEMQPLSKLVTKISLKYKNTVHSYGQMAQGRQSADFWYKAKGGKIKKGTVEDIWFAPLPAGAK